MFAHRKGRSAKFRVLRPTFDDARAEAVRLSQTGIGPDVFSFYVVELKARVWLDEAGATQSTSE